jgi:hypothetical protein
MRRFGLAICISLIVLVVGAVVFTRENPNDRQSADTSNMLVAAIGESERSRLELADVSDCRGQALAGQEPGLGASSSKQAREDLGRHSDLVAEYCECKFRGTARFMTKGEMVKQWLSTTAGLREPLSARTKERLDRVVANCASEYGLRI